MYPDSNSRSAALFQRAQATLPGGNSRHSIAGRPYPIYAATGEGCRLADVDGASYIDCVNNMSANIHGHRHPAVQAAVARQMGRLVSVGFPTELEVEFAELMVARVPSVERIRFMNSGTEALMFAVRAARAFTGRSKVAKIEGGYHGSHESLDVSNRPEPELWGDADEPAVARESAGFTDGSVADTLVLPVNQVEAARAIIRKHGADLAAVVLDPFVSRMGFLPLSAEFLAMAREETRSAGALLIFDEVFSFRLGPSGAQGVVGADPDLTTFGKIIGGGFPIGALGGRADVMDVFNHVSPGGPKVEHSGTFNANPISIAAGRTTMELLDADAFSRLERLGLRLRDGLRDAIEDLGLAAQVQGRGSLWAFLPHQKTIVDYRSHHQAFKDSLLTRGLDALYGGLVNRGVLPIYPSGFVLSTAMDEAVIDDIVVAAHGAMRDLAATVAQAA